MSREIGRKHESGVSETVGFIIIMGIVLTGIGLVTLYGYPALIAAQQNANIKNMERNMISLQSDFNTLTYKNVPYKETMLQVSGGTLFSSDSSSTPQRFLITHGTVGTPVLDTGLFTGGYFYPGDLRYISDGNIATITLENGAVITSWISDSVGSSMLSEPRWYTDSSDLNGDGVKELTLVINLIQIKSDHESRTGMSNIRLEISPLDLDPAPGVTNIIQLPTSGLFSPPDNTVSIIYEQNGAEKNNQRAWDNFFNKDEFSDTSGPRDYLLVTKVDRLIVKGYVIRVY
jgi:hypothetical protein